MQEVLPARLDMLSAAVQTTPHFENWGTDFMPASLNQLGEWYAPQVHTQPRTPDEMRKIQAELAMPIELQPWDITPRTFSLAFDIGLHLSQVFLKSHASLRWDQPFGDKHFIDYGYPVHLGASGSAGTHPQGACFIRLFE